MAPIAPLDDLVRHMDTCGYSFESDVREFVPRKSGPARDQLVLNVRQALEWVDPDRYLDRSDEMRDPLAPPVTWPDWAW